MELIPIKKKKKLRQIALFVLESFPNLDLVAADGTLIQDSPVEILSIF